MKKLRLALLIALAILLLTLPVLGVGENEPKTGETPLPQTGETETKEPVTEPAASPETEPATPPVTAEKVEGVIRSVTVTVDLPEAGKTGCEVKESDVKIAASVNGAERILEAPLEFGVDGYEWLDLSGVSPVKMGANAVFVGGVSYALRIRFNIDLNGLLPDGKTLLYVNGKEASLSTRGSSYELEAKFVCAPEDLSPKVTLTVEEAEKVYDGTPVLLKLSVEKSEGVLYRCEWYRDGVALTYDGPETFEVKSVSQSGKYYCKVYATPEFSNGETEYFTETLAYQINLLPRSVVVQIENAEKNLFDDDPEFTYTVIGEIFDELQGKPEREEGEDIGSYAIGKGTLAFADDVAENYSVEYREGRLSVLKVDELPFSAVSGIGDLSYITGKNGARIRISASKGALPKGGIIKLEIASDEARAALESAAGKEILKSFSVSIVNEDGEPISLPKHASLKLLIPLSEEEETYREESITAGLYTTAAALLDSALVEEGGVTYLSVQISELGVIALFEGQPDPVVTQPAPSQKPAVPEEKDSPLLWAVSVILSLLAAGGAVFSYLYIKKNGLPKKKTTPSQKNKKPLAATTAEKERMRRIADKMNAMPPVPENSRVKKTSENNDENEKRQERTMRVISFDDLEEL